MFKKNTYVNLFQNKKDRIKIETKRQRKQQKIRKNET
jgi:hypothetical protein